ncbi:hypothetical protein ATE47_10845 [Chryseobacterium sp. IHB B 17019]|jgi:hypothetical protein|nr:hypothetical protein ATE47_10845 [Chryseobacterium sp. IHB B 17019]
MGTIIPIPFIFWLAYTVFSFGNIDQIFAILGIIGIILSFIKWKNDILISIISFALMLSPIISRLLQIPIYKFNYLGFIIPFSIFVLLYSVFIILKYFKVKNEYLSK